MGIVKYDGANRNVLTIKNFAEKAKVSLTKNRKHTSSMSNANIKTDKEN